MVEPDFLLISVKNLTMFKYGVNLFKIIINLDGQNMSNVKYYKEGYAPALTEEQIAAMSIYNLKEISRRTCVSYYLIRRALKGYDIPKSVHSALVDFLEKHKLMD